MNFLATGVREVTRRLRRSKNRLALVNARKFVDKAETALGRFGWRDLADDEAVAPTYAELRHLDEEMAGFHAHVAELEGKIREQDAAREEAAHVHREALEALDAERAPAGQALLDLQDRRAEHQKALHALTARTAALRAEQAALLKQEKRAARANRLADEPTRAASQKALDDQRAALAEQAAQVAVARSQAVEPLVNAQEGIKETRARLSALDNRVQEVNAALAAREREIDLAVAGLNKEIAATRRQAARVDDQKDEFYLAMGHRLAERAAMPIGGDELFSASRRQRQSYEKLAALEAAWLQESQNADKQDLRIFNFVAVTAAVLVALALLLAFHAPARRDWLPRETQTILTVDVSRFTDADFTRALQIQRPDTWEAVWSGLVRKVAEVPQIDVRHRVQRITRAFAPPASPGGPPTDYLLVAMRESADVDNVLTALPPAAKGGYEKRSVNGLPIYENKGGLAVAQIGPDTMALGTTAAVETLIRVRLGLPGSEDLKSDAQFFSEFQRLDNESAFRLVTYQPRELMMSLADPVFDAQLLGDCQTLGMTLDMHEPVSAVILLNAASYPAAGQMAHTLEAHPDQVLQLVGAGPNLFIEPPLVKLNDKQVEWRFRMTAPAAREFLERVSRLGMPPAPPEPDKAVATQ